ncbi:alkaline phosphatase 4-like [Neocloeon triangulifer]|uniref:alkaline phosphatase 4-like n=1 Tax=Neocloeon triangulifer TaxID=2078957 RepID=UPI00286F46C5|nr:alkaline phosphatase 4-like [Neocloeon triangulifer]
MRAVLVVTFLFAVCGAAPSDKKQETEIRMVKAIEDKEVWFEEAQNRLDKVTKKKQIENKAKNIILFIGDGMGIATVTTSRIYRGQLNGNTGEESFHSFELFSNVGLIKTYTVNMQVPDSAATATAMLCGVKTNQEVIGFDANAIYDECNSEIIGTSKVESLFKWAQDIGKRTGVVTTTRITHATPAAGYAHINNRDWECDSEIPEEYKSCTKDIARQLVEDEPGKNLNVIFGGGLQQMGFGSSPSESSCKRTDGKNLTSQWENDRATERVSYGFVTNREQMEALSTEQKVLGLFGYGHMSFDLERDTTPTGSPSIADMTEKAIELLQGAQNGYFLMVEGGRIDHAHHGNYARLALDEAVRFDEAIEKAFNITNEDDTLIIVTADHSHAMTMNGYPERGNDILGFAQKTTDKEFAYETITYANGPGYNVHKKLGAIAEGEYMWIDPSTLQNRDDTRYGHFAPIYESIETHSGEDVAIYANGPFSHLFNGVFEQSYVAHAISCAGKFGPSADYCNSALSARPSALLLCLLIIVRSLFA